MLIKIAPKNHAPEDIFRVLPEAIFKIIKDTNPRAIPFAIENVNGIITIIIRAGNNSVASPQFNFSIPPSIRIAT